MNDQMNERMSDYRNYIFAISLETGCAISELELDFIDELQKSIEILPDEMQTLIGSAKHYPPALALARDAVINNHHNISNEFIDDYVNKLELFLIQQPNDGFVLIKSKKTYNFELRKGMYVWTKKEPKLIDTILWVSWDYVLYEAPLDVFEISN